MVSIVITVLIIAINALFGAEMISLFDHKDNKFINWIKKDPTHGFLIFLFLSFWPIFLYFMLRKENT